MFEKRKDNVNPKPKRFHFEILNRERLIDFETNDQGKEAHLGNSAYSTIDFKMSSKKGLPRIRKQNQINNSRGSLKAKDDTNQIKNHGKDLGEETEDKGKAIVSQDDFDEVR